MQQFRDDQGYQTTIHMLRIMFGADPASGLFERYDQFGVYGYSLIVTLDHVGFLQYINEVTLPISQAFDPEIVQKWKTINELLIHAYHPESSISRGLKTEFPGLAVLLAFPILEEVARRISKAWDEDGKLLIDVPASLVVCHT